MPTAQLKHRNPKYTALSIGGRLLKSERVWWDWEMHTKRSCTHCIRQLCFIPIYFASLKLVYWCLAISSGILWWSRKFIWRKAIKLHRRFKYNRKLVTAKCTGSEIQPSVSTALVLAIGIRTNAVLCVLSTAVHWLHYWQKKQVDSQACRQADLQVHVGSLTHVEGWKDTCRWAADR